MTTAQETWTILEVLDWTRSWFERKGMPSARLEAELIVANALGMERIMLYAHFDRPLGDAERKVIRGHLERRARGEPIAYILGRREFWSQSLTVTPAVLIPRPDTEVLVEVVLALLRAGPVKVADVGTGSGAIARAIAAERPDATIYALELSPEACAVARANLSTTTVTVLESDLLSALPEPVDAIVANLPYIRRHELAGLMRDVRDFEPHLALDGGEDGLDAIRALIAAAPDALLPDGLLALEAGFDQVDQVAALLSAAGFSAVETRRDYGDQPRVAFGRWNPLSH